MDRGLRYQSGRNLVAGGATARGDLEGGVGLPLGIACSAESWSASRLSEFEACRRWLKSEIETRLGRLLSASTGLSFCTVWAGPFTAVQDVDGRGFCPRWQDLGPGRTALAKQCAGCRLKNWERSATAGKGSYRFRGLCGAPTLWIELRVRDLMVGRAVFQARPRPGADEEAPGFGQAVELLDVLLAQAAARIENQGLRKQLETTRRLQQYLETEVARLRHELHARLPEVPEKTAPPGEADRTRNTVGQMLSYVREHYQRPMSLGEVAQALGRNPSHLSTMFAQATGVPFHAYVDELRLAKAKQLLSDSTRSIIQVACETGYASDDWFRHAFKAHTGLSPSAWREARLIRLGRKSE